MEEEKKHIDELIATYLTEGLDKNALAELKAWIAASPENKNYFIQQREVWFSISFRFPIRFLNVSNALSLLYFDAASRLTAEKWKKKRNILMN